MTLLSYFCNMRFRYIYNIESVDKLVLKLLTLSKNIEYISILISNPKSLSSVPKEYINYDLIAGIDKIDDLKCNLNVFDKLKKFYNQKDWMFGYLSYDLKNDIERLQSNNNDIIKSNKLSFFIPKYVFLLIGKRLEILSYEPKDKVDLFFSSLFVGEFTNKFQINLKNRESKKKYLDKIVKIKEHIQRGDIYEMNYCTEFFAEKDSLDCESLFLNLNTIAKTPFSAFLKINEHTIISASPERFIKKKGNNLIGFYEQEYHPESNEIELINMGILREFRGLKLGSTLLNHAIASASRKNPNRMWVHTCSLDHKYALQNYRSKGFEIFKEEEIDFVA